MLKSDFDIDLLLKGARLYYFLIALMFIKMHWEMYGIGKHLFQFIVNCKFFMKLYKF